MNKEEAKRFITQRVYENDDDTFIDCEVEGFAHNIADVIYKEFESRTCENCKYFENETRSTFASCDLGIAEHEILIDNFGCNKWASNGNSNK